LDLDNLSIILIIIEGIITGAIFASALIVGKKFLKTLPLMSTGLKIVLSISFAGVLLIVFAIRFTSSILELYFARFKKEFKFYFAYTKYVALEQANSFKQNIVKYIDSSIYSFKEQIINRGSPHIQLQTGDFSSQSYLKISPIILQ